MSTEPPAALTLHTRYICDEFPGWIITPIWSPVGYLADRQLTETATHTIAARNLPEMAAKLRAATA